MVAQGTFRDDLYYRLNVGAIHLPPLRERPEDIEPLVGHFVAICNEKLGRTIAGVSPQVLAILMRYQWPGNVRELANVIERAMVVAKGSVILPEHLPPHLFEARPAASSGDGLRLPELSLEAAEREQILRALQASGGKRIEAARLLGLSRRTLYRKLDRYGIA
jgi:transcriptional regulator with PAS, ATPase and Fis domain